MTEIHEVSRAVAVDVWQQPLLSNHRRSAFLLPLHDGRTVIGWRQAGNERVAGYTFIGGGQDAGESDPLITAEREWQEESGSPPLQMTDVRYFLKTQRVPGQKYYDVVFIAGNVVALPHQLQLGADGELERLELVKINELPEMVPGHADFRQYLITVFGGL